MLIQLPRLTTSLREPIDVDHAYLQRKFILQKLQSQRSNNSLSDSALARMIIPHWNEASIDLQQVYREFLGSVLELIDGEVTSEEVQMVAKTVYDIFCALGVDSGWSKTITSKKRELQALLGHTASDASLQKAASLAHKVWSLQSIEHGDAPGKVDEVDESSCEFGINLVFKAPGRFLVGDVSHDIEEGSFDENFGGYGILPEKPHDFDISVDGAGKGNASLRWLKDICDQIVKGGGSQLSGDELAMAICRVLESDKPGDEIAGDLLDLVGDSSFDMIEELLSNRKKLVDAIRHGFLNLRTEKVASTTQPRMPSYGTQVTIKMESERQIDKLRRKEEKRYKRGADRGVDNEFSTVLNFSSLLLASEKKQPCDDLFGKGQDSSYATALPQGTVRNSYRGYEEVRIPPTSTSPMKPGEKLIEISELDDFSQAAFCGYKSLNRIQSWIFRTAYYTNENILVCAPTGAGKTNIAMITILHEIGQHFKNGILLRDEFKVVYVAPMKALAAEVASTFSHRLAPLNLNVRELTGDMQLTKNELEQTQMIVTTPEKWDVITRKSNDMSLSVLVKLLIIDEVHLLNDDRGPVIEALVARTLRQVESTQTMIRIVGLSATLPNYLEVAQFLRVSEKGLFFFDSSYRPVPLAQQYIGITEKNFAARNDLLNEICYNKVVDSLKHGYQAMVFVHSRKDTGKTARNLIELARRNEDLELFQNDNHPQYSLIKREVHKSRNRELVEVFESGFGIHHAGMLRADRSLTERLFSDGLLKVLVCTATLAWGVNLPAHTVVIKGTQLYDPKAGGWRELGMLDVMQIFGRAGRPQFDKCGEGIIITTHDKLAHYLRLLTNQLPIESQFVNSLKDNLNAEVALGTVTNVKEACAWLGYTYLFIRMKSNPLAYGIGWDEVLSDPSLVSKQRNFVTDAARALDKAKMMRFDEKSGNFYCTELGRIASHFYLQYSTVETYNDMLRRHMNESEVITMVAHSSEFENIVVREEEQNELENLAQICPLEVRGGPGDKYGKISILIQLYISHGSLESFSLIADAAYISASLARIMRALFEICLRQGWCEMTSLMLEYSKAVDHQIWPHQHPLRQFDKDLSPEILRKLEERGADLDRLVDMEEREIGALLRYGPAGKIIKQCLCFFPWIQLSASVSPITRTVLKVDLLITPDFIWKDRFHGASQRWWILVEDSENDTFYHSELFTLTKKMGKGGAQKLSFTVPIFEPHPPQYYIRAISDTWLHAETFHILSFQNLTLPDMKTTHTELLDLKPLPISALGNRTYGGLYNFSHFNPIQTQTFHVLYHTDNNVLLGAPTGSGKTISAELAMLHLFNTQPDMKVIYIAPLKAIVRERMNDWRKRLVSVLGKKMVELTGDFTPDLMVLLSADVIISTPEKWDGISRNWHGRSYVMKVGLMILDEIHLLGADRGPILEVIVSRMRYISSQTDRSIRFVGLSTALANAHDLANWLGVDDIGFFNFKPSVRPVPLEVHIQGYPGKFYCPRMNSMNKPAYAAICTHSPTKPVLIFVSSRRQTRLTALDLIQFAASDERARQFLSIPEDSLEMLLSQVTDLNLRHTLQFGIGLHHAGLNDRDRSLVEELFVNNKIQVLVCTSTLAWGVNLPAHLVVIKGTEYYDGRTKRYVDFPITDILQMMGRAGRPQYDQHGKAVVLVHEPKKSFYKKFLYEPFPVESSLREQLHDHINAEIVSGTVRNKEDAVHYLTWTYLFRRLVVNPTYYGLDDTESGTVNSYLSKLVQNTLEDLEDSGCIKIDDNSVEPSMLGSIASQYYLSYMTVSMFRSNISRDTSLEVFLHILSGASEYDELPVRHNEEHYNEDLSEKVPYLIDKYQLDDPHVKANLLFQAHFSRLQLPISDYTTDLKSLMDQSIRIIQAMIDICANSGWLSSAITCMHLLQMVMQTATLDSSKSTLFKGLPNSKEWYQQQDSSSRSEIVTVRAHFKDTHSRRGLLGTKVGLTESWETEWRQRCKSSENQLNNAAEKSERRNRRNPVS
ncbi:DExH-box ATP-dependent RNA helicase DExH14 [Amborella trichopoda]|uniref:DExH-box ATP-dependent RNA helicase DExH14 n=1 Tax=Amborella trichopoda TaxID=13333 RepID=UPI0009C0A990|nr:DExH-box ATP-dependent RNA helicase DExH14 [Amborella trichopoda]|eukprot:XP_020519141.1 DExH-box ATP-dependent RNA helicase DExH14 [Amborella trichopoda]